MEKKLSCTISKEIGSIYTFVSNHNFKLNLKPFLFILNSWNLVTHIASKETWLAFP